MPTIIGENFPKSRQARKDQLTKIKTGAYLSTIKVPGKGIKNVYKIPLEYLSYNPYNTRFIVESKTLEKRFGCELSDEYPEHIRAIEEIIWQQKKDQNKNTINSLIKEGQLQPGVVTSDGIILSGNRRFRLLNEINRNPDYYRKPGVNIEGLQFFEAVILDDELSKRDIVTYESFYQYGTDDKVEYDPIQKYLAAYEQKSIGFKNIEIAQNFSTLTEGGKEGKVEEWLETFELMKQYLSYFEEEGIYTSLTSKEEAFLNLRRTLKGYRTGRRGGGMWAYDDNDLVELQLRYFDYIRMNLKTHDFRIFPQLFSDETEWKKFNSSVKDTIKSEENIIASFEEYRQKYPEDDEKTISMIRANDYTDKVRTDLIYLQKSQEIRIDKDKLKEKPMDLIQSVVNSLDKLKKIIDSLSGLNIEDLDDRDPKKEILEVLSCDNFLNGIKDIQKRVGKIKQQID